jgi:DNA processing protein
LSDSERERVKGVRFGSMDAVLAQGARLLEAADLPERLRERAGMPPALYVWGNVQALSVPAVAIVGTRSASVYGKAAAGKFSEALCRAGVCVISGGALGIDAAAHKACMESGGTTIAVMASGIDRSYPAVHSGMFKRIRESGCLVSQFACGAMPKRHSFVARNNLIAALADAVLVVEAPESSGALITAFAANDLGRQVFVVPASITSTTFRGSHALIRSGATLVDHPDQILFDLGLPSVLESTSKEGLSAAQSRILEVLGAEPKSAEAICHAASMDASELLAELTMLELSGRIVRAAGGYALKP